MNKVSVIVPVYNVENYLEGMFRSLQQQTFGDFEVIVVNDGSTDGSQDIIDGFCKEDSRFRSIVKENGGVASARNRGIDEASGQYVVFYDPDDYIPKNSLAKMYAVASRNRADMVVGVMEEKSLGESLIYMHSQKLASQKRIFPLDTHFIGAWSLCHKMFSLDFIRKNHLRIEKMSNAEDGVFTFSALNHTDRIFGCNVVAYHYIKRPFWLAPSATQIISNKYLDGLLASHDRILEEATKLADKHLSPEEKERYLQPLYIRFIEGEMINGYYRGIWRAEDDLISRIEERTALYRKHITEEQWLQLLHKHRDIGLAGGFRSMEELAEQPQVSIILSAPETTERIHMMLGSIYQQAYPMFEVLVPEKTYDLIDPVYRDKRNLRMIPGSDFKENAIGSAKGQFLLFLDEFAMFTKNSLKQMVTRLMNAADLDFVSMLFKTWDGEEYKQIPCLSAAYGYTKRGRRTYGTLTSCDTFLSNKLFRKSVVSGFRFTANKAQDVAKLYSALSFEKLRKGVMITDLSGEEILDASGVRSSALSIRLNYAKNEGIRRTMERMKRIITREDIDRIKKWKSGD